MGTTTTHPAAGIVATETDGVHAGKLEFNLWKTGINQTDNREFRPGQAKSRPGISITPLAPAGNG